MLFQWWIMIMRGLRLIAAVNLFCGESSQWVRECWLTSMLHQNFSQWECRRGMFVFAQLEKITAVRTSGVTAKLSRSRHFDMREKKHTSQESEEWILCLAEGLSRSRTVSSSTLSPKCPFRLLLGLDCFRIWRCIKKKLLKDCPLQCLPECDKQSVLEVQSRTGNIPPRAGDNNWYTWPKISSNGSWKPLKCNVEMNVWQTEGVIHGN